MALSAEPLGNGFTWHVLSYVQPSQVRVRQPVAADDDGGIVADLRTRSERPVVLRLRRRISNLQQSVDRRRFDLDTSVLQWIELDGALTPRRVRR